MPLKVYNTLSRTKENFIPYVAGRVGMYVCGPTVYDHSHIGHAKSYISFDVILRYLRSLGYKVLYVQNITDVGHLTDDADEGDDKIEKSSRRDKIHPMQLAENYIRSFYEDMDALGVIRPDISPRASGHITEQIDLITTLIGKGFAYEVNGSVYFSVQAFKDYGKLSGRTVEEMEAGARVGVRSEKRHPADFALWKKAEQGHILRWPSPWGDGYPGWHIECSAMSMKYLGVPPDAGIDIHGGGIENQFPHHECEIAQSEGATGKRFVKYWLHNNMVTVDGVKMGKSLGNSISLKDAFKKWGPIVVRFFVLQSHYRSPLDFSDTALQGAAKGLEKLQNTIKNLGILREKNVPGVHVSIDLEDYRRRFIEAMDDDFNTPQAIAVLFDCSREVNSFLHAEKPPDIETINTINGFYEEFGGGVLGLVHSGIPAPQAGLAEDALMSLLIELRAEARNRKLWDIADIIRDRLQQLGIVLEDGKEGTRWKKNSS
jgi:cysteinyl-tRNA synthetase